MPIHLFNAKRVAEAIKRNEIGSEGRKNYLLASFLLFSVLSYAGLTSNNPLWSWLSIYEGVVVCVITVFGITKAYEAAGGDSNKDFVAEFTCLSVPVYITTMLLVWRIHWGIIYGLREFLTTLSSSHTQFAMNLANIGGDFFGLLTFLAVVLVQLVSFYRIKTLLELVHAA